MYVTGTFTVPLFVPFSAVSVANTSSEISPIFTSFASFGNFALKSSELATSVAFAFATSFTLSTVVPFGTVTSSFTTGNTVTGTLTSSVTSVPFTLWVTVVGIVNPGCPALPSVLKISLVFGSLAVPLFPSIVTGSTFSLTLAGVISSPSNTTTGFVLDLTTFTSISTVVSKVLPSTV